MNQNQADQSIHNSKKNQKNYEKGSLESFASYELSEPVLKALALLNYKSPTPIQKRVIPVIKKGRDLVAVSHTGSGKTAAFAIPICDQIRWEENLPQALVLEPARELACQVGEEIYHIGRNKALKVPVLYGGFSFDKQDFTLRQKTHIVTGTPGRVLEHLKMGTLKAEKLEYVVIDEADLMFSMGFIDEVKEILSYVPDHAVKLLFSATMEDSLKPLMKEYMKKPEFILMESKTVTADTIKQSIYEVSGEEKFDLLLELLIKEKPASAMIFCGTKEMVNVLCRKLGKEQVPTGILHGDIDQEERMKTIAAFRDGRIRYLIATDVAARGFDVENLTHVINYDFPGSKEAYVHRVGRTGRNKNTGMAISFVTADEQSMRKQTENYIGMEIPVAKRANREITDEERKAFFEHLKVKEVKKKKADVFRGEITTIMIGGGRKSKLRAGDILGTLCSIDGVTGEDIGAIEIRDSATYVEIRNNKAKKIQTALSTMTLKGKVRKARIL
ncbi:MAG: DEAD/DEAH box helicase [Lachnospiraceae bacterium]|nr:DEAD/DEAH box helicase [Lachnospiraceae bacterium]